MARGLGSSLASCLELVLDAWARLVLGVVWASISWSSSMMSLSLGRLLLQCSSRSAIVLECASCSFCSSASAASFLALMRSIMFW